MRTRRMRAVAPFLAVALALGCTSDSAGPDDVTSPIDSSESVAMTNTLVSAMSETFNSGGTQQSIALSAGESVPISITYSHTKVCPEGGSISLSGNAEGSLDLETGTGSVFVQVVESVSACYFGFTKRQIVITSNPSINATGTFTFVDGQLESERTVEVGGGFNFTIDGAATGFCAVDLTVNLSITPGETATSGTVCGHRVSFTL